MPTMPTTWFGLLLDGDSVSCSRSLHDTDKSDLLYRSFPYFHAYLIVNTLSLHLVSGARWDIEIKTFSAGCTRH